MQNSSYFSGVKEILPGNLTEINTVIEDLIACIAENRTIWIIGNGGSASTADHFEVDLSFVRLTANPVSVKAKSLCSNSSLMTAIGNDIGFEKIFAHQLMRNASRGDICFAISASGNSSNLIEAFRVCDELSVKKIALLGFDGGTLRGLANQSILVESKIGLFGPVEDTHLSICHYIASMIKARIFEVFD